MDDLMNETPAEKYRPDHFEGYSTGTVSTSQKFKQHQDPQQGSSCVLEQALEGMMKGLAKYRVGEGQALSSLKTAQLLKSSGNHAQGSPAPLGAPSQG